MNAIALTLMSLCTAWTVLGLAAVLRVRWRRPHQPPAPKHAPPVTVLKPLCGADPDLVDNLGSFLLQDYPSYELVFGVTRADDPAIDVVRELMTLHPSTRARLVVHSGVGGVNPKVDNLLGMLPHAAHDLVLVSDSNVRAPTHYLSELVATLHAHANTGMVTNLFAGAGEDGIGSALESVRLNGFCAAGAALPTLFGDSVVIGKSMLLSKATFHALGGFERVKDVLAEDYVIGKMFQHGGLAVRIAPTVLHNVNRGATMATHLCRHQRWAMLRARLRPWAQLAEVVTSPLAMLPFAWTLIGPAAPLWTLGLLALRDIGGWVALRGWRRAWIPALLSPLGEALMLMLWLRAPLIRHVKWRGHDVRVGAGTFVYQKGAAQAR